MSTVFEAREIKRNRTPEAVCIMHPTNRLKLLFLPKKEIIQQSPVEGKVGHFYFTIPDWLAEEHDLG